MDPVRPTSPLSLWEIIAEEYLHLQGKSWEDEPELKQAWVDNQEFSGLLIDKLHAAKRNAMCLSGGGVRSATFCLGILQQMARYSWKEPGNPEKFRPLLQDFDYLSTVSGAGYAGGWLSSWAARVSMPETIKQLAQLPPDKLDPEPKPLRYIRTYASFLNPQLGATSTDSWTLGTTILRNIVLNWMVLLPLLAAVLVLPRIFDALVGVSYVSETVLRIVLALAFLGGACATGYMVNDLPSAGNARGGQKHFLWFCLTALAISAICLVLYWCWQTRNTGTIRAWESVAFTELLLFTGMVAAAIPSIRRRKREVDPVWIFLGMFSVLVCGLVGGYLSYLGALIFDIRQAPAWWDTRWYAWLAFPSLIFIYGIFQLLLVGAASKITEDEDREWWARCAAWFSILFTVWLIGSGLVLFAGDIFASSQISLLHWTGATTLSGALLSILGFSPKTNRPAGGENGSESIMSLPLASKLREIAIKLIMPVFLLLLVMTLAIGNSQLSGLMRGKGGAWLRQTAANTQVTTDSATFEGTLRAVPAKAGAWVRQRAEPVLRWPGKYVLNEILLLILLAVPGFLAALWVNANKFSLHAMYRSRLIRTFLGASNLNREVGVNPFTGFDEEDNLAMEELKKVTPLHVVNIALNLVKGEKLAWQQRKAESFTVSPLHCGSWQVGYTRSEKYASGFTRRPKQDGPVPSSGISLGSALTISGAAASPNMGYHSSPLLTMIMTLFNARLGAWLANPGIDGRKVWHKNAPTFAVRPFIDEAFGLTTDSNAWVYLSDGGHFENLGLYEMVLRRCHNIVVVDGGADPDYSYEDLGNAVRKIRVDLGIPIEFHDGFPISKTREKTSRHCAVGEIQYGCVDAGATPGCLVYIKTSLNQNEPADILNYSQQNTEFPQQPTFDLWFDEAQLESYRLLGSHIMHEICGTTGSNRTIYSVQTFVDRIRNVYLKDLTSEPPPLER